MGVGASKPDSTIARMEASLSASTRKAAAGSCTSVSSLIVVSGREGVTTVFSTAGLLRLILISGAAAVCAAAGGTVLRGFATSAVRSDFLLFLLRLIKNSWFSLTLPTQYTRK